LSVFGVFKDGRLSSDASDDALGKLAPALGTIPCQAAFDRLADAKVGLADATSDYAMAEGVTDELLDPFAPAAKGDFILTLAMAGKGALGADAGAEPPTSPRPQAQPMKTRRGRGRRSPPVSSERAAAADRNAFEMSVSLYSVRLHHTVAVVSMTYQGRRMDEAFADFRRELAKELPGAACAGWNGEMFPDPERLRALDEH
jgi:hypothetical protein